MKRRLSGGAATATAILLVAACAPGNSDPTGMSGTALAKVVASASTGASSVHVTATRTADGKVSENFSLTRSGDLSGSFNDFGALTVLITKGEAFAKVTPAFLRLSQDPSSVCATVCGKYVRLPRYALTALVGNLGWSALVNPVKKFRDLVYLSTDTVDGEEAWKVRVPGGGYAYVAAQAPHYVLRLTRGADRLDFSRWGTAVIPPPPPASDLVPASTLHS